MPPSSDAMSRGSSQQPGSAGGQDSFQDLIVLYCSYFAYASDGSQKRQEILMTNVNDIIIVAIQRFEQQGVLKEETTQIIQ